MDVAAGHGITNSEEFETLSALVRRVLWLSGQ
jgi:hypothetical protein